jgi:hypothetical protein
MLANATTESVWLDAEAQAELGEVQVVGSRLVGAPEALLFMADNAEDYAQEAGLRGSRLDSHLALAARIRFAVANPGVRYTASAAA